MEPPPRRYRVYLDPNSATEKEPRQAVHNRKKRVGGHHDKVRDASKNIVFSRSSQQSFRAVYGVNAAGPAIASEFVIAFII